MDLRSSPAGRLGGSLALGSWTRILGAVLLVASIGFYLFNAVHFAHQPLRIEEGVWPPMAMAIASHGRPVVPPDENPKLRLTKDLRAVSEESIGAWHPPAYAYSIAALIPVFGDDASYTLRAMGILGLLLTCVLLFLIAREVSPGRWRLIGGAGTVLLFVHPYAIQGSTFIDIDTSLYAPALLLVLWLAIRFSSREVVGPREVLVLGGALALACWLKLTSVPVLVPVLGLWWVLTRRRRGLLEIGAAVAFGAVLFTATYALWCWATSIPFSYTFEHIFVEKSDRLGASSDLIEEAWVWYLPWFMPVLVMLAGAYGVDAAISFFRTRRPRAMDLVWAFGIAVLLAYTVVSPVAGYYKGKYAFPALPALILPVAWMLLRRPLPLPTARGWALIAGLAVLAIMLLPDVLTNQHYGQALPAERGLILLVSANLLLAAWWLASGRGAFLPVGLLVVCGVVFAAQSLDSYRANVSPMYPVTDTPEFKAVPIEIDRVTEPGDIVMVSKDTGLYLRDVKVIEGQDALVHGDRHVARFLRRSPDVRVVSRNSFGPHFGRASNAAIEACFGEARGFGTSFVRVRDRDRC